MNEKKKAILVMDMPKTCYECPLCYCDTDYDYVCSALTIKAKDVYTDDTNEIVNDEQWIDCRYSKCPLKPIPKIPPYLQFGEYVGYEMCLKEITGDEE